MIELPKSLDPEQRRKFWNNPEGKTAVILLFILALGAVTFLPQIMAIFALAMKNAFIGVVSLFGTIMLLSVPLTQKGRFMLKIMIRKLTNAFVKIFPVDILKQHIANLASDIFAIEDQIGLLKGVMMGLQRNMKEQKNQFVRLMDTASYAKKKGSNLQAQVKARQASRLNESNMKIDELYKRLEKLMRVLKKYHEIAKIMKEDLEFDVDLIIKEREAVLAGHAAMVKAMNIIGGRGQLQEMFDMAMQNVLDDVNRRIGEISSFVDMSGDVIAAVNMEQGMVNERGLAMLEEWEQKGEAMLLGEEKPKLLSAATDPGQILNLNEPLFAGSQPEEIAARRTVPAKFQTFLDTGNN